MSLGTGKNDSLGIQLGDVGDRGDIFELNEHVGVLGGSLVVDLLGNLDSHWSDWETGVLLSQCEAKMVFDGIMIVIVWNLDKEGLLLLLGVEVEHLFKLVNEDCGLLLLKLVVDFHRSELRQVVLVDVQICELGLTWKDGLVEEGQEAIIIDEVHSDTESLKS